MMVVVFIWVGLCSATTVVIYWLIVIWCVVNQVLALIRQPLHTLEVLPG